MATRARATNNSVATLEEQSDLLSSVFKDVSKEDKEQKKRQKAQSKKG